MRLTRLLLPAAAAVALTAAAGSAAAQSWPTRPVSMVVPFAAGGGTDVLGRIIGRRLGEVLGQQVVIENVGGAGGMVGSARVAKAPPDGYQFVLGSRADAINQTLYKNPLYNLRTDLVPVVLVADQPTVLVARKDLPADNLQEFIAYAKKNQATMQFGSSGAGSTGHVDCALLNATIGVEIAHVPYRGGGPRDAGPDRRPLRLLLHAQRHHRAADREQAGEADRGPDARARPHAAEPRQRP